MLQIAVVAWLLRCPAQVGSTSIIALIAMISGQDVFLSLDDVPFNQIVLDIYGIAISVDK